MGEESSIETNHLSCIVGCELFKARLRLAPFLGLLLSLLTKILLEIFF